MSNEKTTGTPNTLTLNIWRVAQAMEMRSKQLMADATTQLRSGQSSEEARRTSVALHIMRSELLRRGGFEDFAADAEARTLVNALHNGLQGKSEDARTLLETMQEQAAPAGFPREDAQTVLTMLADLLQAMRSDASAKIFADSASKLKG
jgi:hypothetical protein